MSPTVRQSISTLSEFIRAIAWLVFALAFLNIALTGFLLYVKHGVHGMR